MQREFVAAMRELRPKGGPIEGPLVSIIVLTRNGEEHLLRLLGALDDRTVYRSFEVIVVDDVSDDGTRELLTKAWSFPIRVLRNEENVSFSAGNNQGIAAARGDLILFLNNDVEPINPGGWARWSGPARGSWPRSGRRLARIPDSGEHGACSEGSLPI